MPRTVVYLKLMGLYAGTARRAEGLAGPLLVGCRGVVLEASRDLAASDVRAGLSRREAAYAAPEAHWVEYRPERFRPAAEALWKRCLALTPRVEPLAENEVFLDPTGTPGFSPAVLSALAADLRQELGVGDLELRAGLATSRLVARLAAGQLEREGQGNPDARSGGEGRLPVLPGGVRYLSIEPGREADFLGPLSPCALWTLPAAVGETLARLGLHTLAEVREIPEPALRRLFGPEAFRLRRHARGEDDSPVPLFDQAVSAWAGAAPRLTREVQFPPRPTGWPEVAGLLREAAGELAAGLRAGGQSCLRLHLRLELADGTSRSVRHTPREPLAGEEALAAALEGVVSRLLGSGSAAGAAARFYSGSAAGWESGAASPPVPPRRLQIEAEPSRAAAQLSLLACKPAGSPPPPRAGALAEVLAAVNRTFAAEVLFPATRLELSRRERLRRLIPGFGHAGP